MRHLITVLLACAISLSATAGETTKPAAATATNPNQKTEEAVKATKTQDPFTRTANEATKAATPSAIALAKWLKKNGVIHEKTVIKAPPASR